MNEDLHAEFVSHFTEFLVKYGQLLECCEKCHMDIAGQYLINPTEEIKIQNFKNKVFYSLLNIFNYL